MSHELEDKLRFHSVIRTFKEYTRYSLSANNRRRKDIYTLPLPDQELLSALSYKSKLDQVDKAIQVNAEFLNQMVADPEIFSEEMEDVDSAPSHNHPEGSHSHDSASSSHSHSHQKGSTKPPTDFDMDKVQSTLKQLVRDWSQEGKVERDLSYTPMIQALLDHFSDIPENERYNFRVLVPGTGLGRLAFDIAMLGFTCQGNEFSQYMLLASFFILNRTSHVNQHTIYPYIHSFSNVDKKETMLRPISIPDVLPSDLQNANFSLVAGDFEEIYGGIPDPNEPEAGLWDAVLTCFFVDTAKNIVNYLRIIHKILAPGGVWINLGPLLWHWENNNTNDPSIELDLEELKTLARAIGFEISSERTIDTTYTHNSRGMLGYVYHAAFFVAKKMV